MESVQSLHSYIPEIQTSLEDRLFEESQSKIVAEQNKTKAGSGTSYEKAYAYTSINKKINHKDVVWIKKCKKRLY